MMKGFVAYSKADSEVVKGLMVHLRGLSYAGSIETWYDGHLAPGEEWDPKSAQSWRRRMSSCSA